MYPSRLEQLKAAMELLVSLERLRVERICGTLIADSSAALPTSEPPPNSEKDSTKPCCESRKAENDTTPGERPTC